MNTINKQFLNFYFLVRPEPPQLKIGSAPVSRSHNFTVSEETSSSIQCISRYGNPAARIKWFLGEH